MDAELARIVEDYVDIHTDDVSTLLEDLLAETEKITGRSRWSIGKVEGKLLQMLIKISNTGRVVEVGTFTGYSALAMAEALPDDGTLTTLESSPEFADIAMRYFEKSPYGRKIQLIVGPALQSLKAMPENSDDEALRILRSGGVILVDNVFWRYKIFKKKITNENARAIAAFNEKVRQEGRVEKVMLSVRDGVYLIRKL
jgi:caffeoyl-CoA O-methyltransferase